MTMFSSKTFREFNISQTTLTDEQVAESIVDAPPMPDIQVLRDYIKNG
ncbi:MAG: hypothetical protein AB8F78_05020 [Saprospiraceae bacterium]